MRYMYTRRSAAETEMLSHSTDAQDSLSCTFPDVNRVSYIKRSLVNVNISKDVVPNYVFTFMKYLLQSPFIVTKSLCPSRFWP